jgi:hypothetical protein
VDIGSVVYYPSTPSGTGVEIYATTGESVTASRIHIGYTGYFNVGLWLNTAGTGWINANYFTGMVGSCLLYDVQLYNGGAGIGGNIFDVWTETTSGGGGIRLFLTSDGGASYPYIDQNTFFNYRGYDIQTGELDYYADASVRETTFVGGFYTLSKFNNSGTYTKIGGTDAGNRKPFTNSSASSGTGAEQTIAHGLAATPNRVYLTPSASGITVINENKAADITNIYPIVTSGKAYYWKAEVV